MRILGTLLTKYTNYFFLSICEIPEVDIPKCLAVSANEIPYSLISFNAMAFLSLGKGSRLYACE